MTDPQTIVQSDPIRIIGIELRTSNVKAFETIPPFWARFQTEGIPARVSNALSNDVFAVYTNFEHEGKNNDGEYSLIIGMQVDDSTVVPEGMVATVIPPSKRAVFPVEGGPEKVGETWMKIWKVSGLQKTFISDYERYQSSGKIDIFIGVE